MVQVVIVRGVLVMGFKSGNSQPWEKVGCCCFSDSTQCSGLGCGWGAELCGSYICSRPIFWCIAAYRHSGFLANKGFCNICRQSDVCRRLGRWWWWRLWCLRSLGLRLEGLSFLWLKGSWFISVCCCWLRLFVVVEWTLATRGPKRCVKSHIACRGAKWNLQFILGCKRRILWAYGLVVCFWRGDDGAVFICQCFQ